MSVFTGVKYARYALKALGITEGVLEMTEPKQDKRTLIEEVELEGKQLVERVRELIQEGNIRRLIIKDADGKYLLEIPLTVGVVAGGVFALAAPVMAAIGALAALVARVKIEIVREDDGSSGKDES